MTEAIFIFKWLFDCCINFKVEYV